jgi:Flp pilus assembly protein TadD
MVAASGGYMRSFVLPASMLLLAAGCTVVPERVRDYNADGVFLFDHGDFRRARDSFQGALELAPQDNALRYNLAQSCERLGDTDRAEKLYHECLAGEPGNSPARQALCILMVNQGRTEDAKKLVDEWLAREPTKADAYALDGWLYHHAGDLPRAQSRLQQALQFDASNVTAMNELALIYESETRLDRAYALYERSLEQRPEQPDVIIRVNRLKAQNVSYPHPE